MQSRSASTARASLRPRIECRTFARRRRPVDQGRQDLAHAEVVDGAAEEHRRLPAGQEGGFVEGRRRAFDQLDLARGLLVGGAEALRQQRVVQAVDDLVVMQDGVGETRASARRTAQVTNGGAGSVTVAGTAACTVRAAATGPVICGR